MTRQTARARAGLTLIEVMLAVAILGIGITALVAAASRCLAVVRRAKNFETARHLLAVVEVEEPLQLKEEIEEGSESGSFSGDFRGFSWQRRITMVGEEDEGLYEVSTRINWSELGKTSFEEVVTYLYAPADELSGTVESR
jgi:prepilin-type N-terminal cleavage/methylation domain-containing protein